MYRLITKKGSDNLREASTLDVIDRFTPFGVRIIPYEHLIQENKYAGVDVCTFLARFKNMANLVITNRQASEFENISYKVYKRNIFKVN